MHGMCRPHTERHHSELGAVADAMSAARAALSETRGQVAVAERSADERLTDADRQQATDLLTAAFRDGVIRVEELDERLTAALSAQTAGDLATVTGDLPAQWLADIAATEAAANRAARRRRRWSAELRAYLRVMALLWGIWLVIAISAEGAHHPWPIWPMLGWGIPLAMARPRGRGAQAAPPLRAAREH